MDIPLNRMPGSGTIRGIIAAFRRCWAPLIGYEMIFKALVFLVAAPLSTWLLSLLVAASGAKSITNMAIIPFLLSSPGAVTVLTAGTLLLVSQMAEEAGLLIVAARSRAGKRITAPRVLVFVIRQLPLLVGAALAEMLIVLAWTAPFLAAGIGAYLGQAVREPDRTHVIAHRGDSIHAPENTLSALRKAIELKAETAEIDVQETKDGVIMVLHDNDLLRVDLTLRNFKIARQRASYM